MGVIETVAVSPCEQRPQEPSITEGHGSESSSNDCVIRYRGIWDSAPVLETDKEGVPIAPDDWADDESRATE